MKTCTVVDYNLNIKLERVWKFKCEVHLTERNFQTRFAHKTEHTGGW